MMKSIHEFLEENYSNNSILLEMSDGSKIEVDMSYFEDADSDQIEFINEFFTFIINEEVLNEAKILRVLKKIPGANTSVGKKILKKLGRVASKVEYVRKNALKSGKKQSKESESKNRKDSEDFYNKLKDSEYYEGEKGKKRWERNRKIDQNIVGGIGKVSGAISGAISGAKESYSNLKGKDTEGNKEKSKEHFANPENRLRAAEYTGSRATSDWFNKDLDHLNNPSKKTKKISDKAAKNAINYYNLKEKLSKIRKSGVDQADSVGAPEQ